MCLERLETMMMHCNKFYRTYNHEDDRFIVQSKVKVIEDAFSQWLNGFLNCAAYHWGENVFLSATVGGVRWQVDENLSHFSVDKEEWDEGHGVTFTFFSNTVIEYDEGDNIPSHDELRELFELAVKSFTLANLSHKYISEDDVFIRKTG